MTTEVTERSNTSRAWITAFVVAGIVALSCIASFVVIAIMMIDALPWRQLATGCGC
jgi:hypothetical protein